VSNINLISLDCETSGSDISKGAAMIQIGASMKDGGHIYTYCQTLNPLDENMWWEEEAAQVHKIPQEKVLKSPNRDDIDDGLYDWLIRHGAHPSHRDRNIAVGWNISGFDMPFVKKYLPRTFKLFSRRTLDLNALCFALDGKLDIATDSIYFWNEWKELSKNYAESLCPQSENYGLHNAGWDSETALHSLDYLRIQMGRYL